MWGAVSSRGSLLTRSPTWCIPQNFPEKHPMALSDSSVHLSLGRAPLMGLVGANSH